MSVNSCEKVCHLNPVFSLHLSDTFGAALPREKNIYRPCQSQQQNLIFWTNGGGGGGVGMGDWPSFKRLL